MAEQQITVNVPDSGSQPTPGEQTTEFWVTLAGTALPIINDYVKALDFNILVLIEIGFIVYVASRTIIKIANLKYGSKV